MMRSEAWDRVEQKIRCLRAIVSADVNEKQGMLLLNLVHTYLELEGPEAERFDTLKKQELKEVSLSERLLDAGSLAELGLSA